MSQKQLSRYLVIERSLEGGISVKEAAAALGVRERQLKRLKDHHLSFIKTGVVHQPMQLQLRRRR